jgi:hypothetical protein
VLEAEYQGSFTGKFFWGSTGIKVYEAPGGSRSVIGWFQQEVGDALTGFLQSQKSMIRLAEAVEAAKQSANLASIQYQSGATNYTTVISAQQSLLTDQDSLTVAQGAVSQGLIAVYRSLGGGWELREGKPFLPADITTAMGKRTDWGGLLEPAAVRPLDRRQLLTPDW